MSENILEKIIKKKIEKIDKLKKHITIKSLEEKIKQNNTFINFKDKITNNIINNKISIIAEIKKASPSAGIIIKDYDPVNIAQIYYNNNTTCLSDENKRSIHFSFQSNENWPYDWSGYCAIEGYTSVPDDNFEQALIDLGYDDVLDNYALTENISGVTELYVNYMEIIDLTGIEDFTALSYLNCRNNQLTSLDISNNTALEHLD